MSFRSPTGYWLSLAHITSSSCILEDLRHLGLDLCLGPVGVLLAEPGGFEPTRRPIEPHRQLEPLPAGHLLECFDLDIIAVHAVAFQLACQRRLYRFELPTQTLNYGVSLNKASVYSIADRPVGGRVVV